MTFQRAFLLGAVALALGACGSSSSKSCVYGGKSHSVGETFPDSDHCNTCSCGANGAVACTLLACAPDGGAAGTSGGAGTTGAAGSAGTAGTGGTGGVKTDASADGADGSTSDAGAQDAKNDVADAGGCTLPGTYTFGSTGGLVAFSDEATISPPDHYHHVRTRYRVDGSPTAECSPSFPACGAKDVITVLDITRDLADPDVQAAFAKASTPVYGLDQRPVDGPIYSVTRADGRGFLVGAPCAVSTNCTEIPAGVKTLADHLKQLDSQQLAKTECASVKNP
jgi:hypothetical protein